MILNFHAWLKLHIQNMNMHCVANLLVSSLGRLLVTSLRAYRQNSKSHTSGRSIPPQTHPSIRASDKLTSLKNLFPCCVIQWGLQVKTRLALSIFFFFKGPLDRTEASMYHSDPQDSASIWIQIWTKIDESSSSALSPTAHARPCFSRSGVWQPLCIHQQSWTQKTGSAREHTRSHTQA